jgi:hypothetical protein
MALTFKLGNLTLAGFELPEMLPLGGDQAHSVHDFPGGDRSAQVFGYHRRMLSFSGTLLGADALNRSGLLESLVAQGQVVPFQYGGDKADVLPVRYYPDVHNQFEIAYTIELVVVVDHSLPFPTQLPDTDSAILAAIQAAQGHILRPLSSNFPPQWLLTGWSQFSVDLDNTFPWSSLAFDIAQALIAEGQGLETQLESYCQGLRTNALILDDLDRLLDSEEALSGIRMIRMSLDAFFGVSSKSAIWIAATTVFDLASQLYGDATQGMAIAQANGLTDPQITTPTKISIPASAITDVPTSASSIFTPTVA